jgi:hypothetical protein
MARMSRTGWGEAPVSSQVPCPALNNPNEDMAQYPDCLDLHQRVTSAMCCTQRRQESRRSTKPHSGRPHAEAASESTDLVS